MATLDGVSRRLAAAPAVEAVYVFGSEAAGTATKGSDIDLAIVASGPVTLAEELRLRAIAVEELRRDDIDFVILNHATPLLRYEVITRGRRLFAHDAAVADAFELRAMAEYFDTAYLRRLRHELLREASS